MTTSGNCGCQCCDHGIDKTDKLMGKVKRLTEALKDLRKESFHTIEFYTSIYSRNLILKSLERAFRNCDKALEEE